MQVLFFVSIRMFLFVLFFFISSCCWVGEVFVSLKVSLIWDDDLDVFFPLCAFFLFFFGLGASLLSLLLFLLFCGDGMFCILSFLICMISAFNESIIRSLFDMICSFSVIILLSLFNSIIELLFTSLMFSISSCLLLWSHSSKLLIA
uniref:Uncharacterized protein n=1 Tax=Cacopsylla melanoneura TaxID=428564 RepID=A0A8D8M3I3_9HEMI